MNSACCHNVVVPKYVLLETERVPDIYLQKIPCDYEGGNKYRNLIEYIKKLEVCKTEYEMLLEQIKVWDENQKKIIADMKKRYNLE